MAAPGLTAGRGLKRLIDIAKVADLLWQRPASRLGED